MGEDGEWETNTCQPHLTYRKKIYEDYVSAEDAIEQMKKIDSHNASYHILPIYTPEESYDKVRVAYKERTNKQ